MKDESDRFSVKQRRLPDSVLVTIDRLHPEGYGTASCENRRLAVFGTLPGERVRARPVRRRGKVLFSQVEEIVERAATRVAALCPHAEVCAGCCMQHLEGTAQLRFKEDLLRSLLAPDVPEAWLPPVEGPRYGYRSKARLGVKFVDKKGRLLIGFREKMSSYIAEIGQCPILVPAIGDLLPRLIELVGSMDARHGIPQIEVAAGDDEAALVFRHLEALSQGDLDALRGFAAETGTHIYLQPAGLDSVRRLAPAGGPERLYYALPSHGLRMSFHPADFTQVNLAANRRMVTQALDLLAVDANDRVLDLFCGIGNLTLPLARAAGEVHGIEGSVTAVERARENTAGNGIGNARFECADLYLNDLPPGIGQGAWSKVIVDPPRSGAERVCRALTATAVGKILYISCNPATLARDTRILIEGGFRLERAGVVDMFPHTSHVESMALFSRGDG